MIIRTSILVLTAAAMASTTHAYFSGASFFSQAPSSQLGPVTNNLTITDTATGFVVSGTVSISVPAGYHPGTLLSFVVDRPLDPSWGTGSFWTDTVLDGFCAPPSIGTFAPTSGAVRSEVTSYPVASLSQIPITLTNGAATWSNLTNSSPVFTYTSGGVNYLRQRFDVDGVQTAGPGGTWLIDVPITTTLHTVPEPTTIATLTLGMGALLLQRKRHRRSRG